MTGLQAMEERTTRLADSVAQRWALPAQTAGIAAIVGGVLLWHRGLVGGASAQTGTGQAGAAALFALVVAVAAYTAGFPDARGSVRGAAGAAAAAAVLAAGLLAVRATTGQPLLPGPVLAVSGAVVVPWVLVCGHFYRRRWERAGSRILVVGTSDLAEAISADLDATPERGGAVVAHLPGEASPEHITEEAVAAGATVVVIGPEAHPAMHVPDGPEPPHIVSAAVFAELWLAKIPLTDGVTAYVEGRPGPGSTGVTRALDLSIAAVGLVALLVLLPAVLVGNLCGNRGPLFYRQDRTGREGRVFPILKLRTMRAPADADAGADWLVDDADPRITPVGRVLRVTHVDELPQVVNVLRGDLAIVGPRPTPLQYAALLLADLPGYEARQSVLPGMTGWAQVKYGYAGDAVGAREKLQYDLFYVRHRGLWFDLRIIGRTIRTVLGGPRR